MSDRVFEAFQPLAGAPPVDLEFETVTTAGVQIRFPAFDPVELKRLLGGLEDARGELRARPVREIARCLGGVGERLLDPSDPLRHEALDHLPATSGLSPEMAAAVLDGMAADWVEGRLLLLLARELGDPDVLDGFVDRGEQRVMAVGPRLTVQIVSGSVPGVGVSALLRSLLLKSPTFLKPGLGDVVLPVVFARGLEAADPALGRALSVLYWAGGDTGLEDVVVGGAEAVVVYGDDDTVGSLRARTPVTTQFLGYHHRVSVGVVGREALDLDRVDRVAAEVAGAVAFFDGRGCVSPQAVYVEEGGPIDPRAFAERLAEALGAVEGSLPGGPLSIGDAAALHQLRGAGELLAASGAGVELHQGGDASWTVLFESAARVEGSCRGRVVRVRPLADATDVVSELGPLRGHLQTVGAAGLGDRLERMAEQLAELGVSRVVPFGAVPFPPPWWHHDGGSPLRDLVRWVDLAGL